ncbi:EthD domain-containing protein [Nocardia sp. NPDC057663]|uniref:EthD domain-containing protein n=1 Tax=Nocardia sp. NPDC057663 TaxID=3346201 RepID=UPI00366E65B1
MTGATAAGLSAILASQPAAADVGSDPIKLTCAIRRRPDLSPAEFYGYWLHRHGPFAVEQIKILGGLRYVQSHATDSTQNLVLTTTRGAGQPFDGLVEVWFPSEHALIAALATPAGIEANLGLTEDEKNFIDVPNSAFFLTKEHVLLG